MPNLSELLWLSKVRLLRELLDNGADLREMNDSRARTGPFAFASSNASMKEQPSNDAWRNQPSKTSKTTSSRAFGPDARRLISVSSHFARPHRLAPKRLGSRYRSGRSPDWLKFKNPAAPAVWREAEEDWGR